MPPFRLIYPGCLACLKLTKRIKEPGTALDQLSIDTFTERISDKAAILPMLRVSEFDVDLRQREAEHSIRVRAVKT